MFIRKPFVLHSASDEWDAILTKKNMLLESLALKVAIRVNYRGKPGTDFTKFLVAQLAKVLNSKTRQQL